MAAAALLALGLAAGAMATTTVVLSPGAPGSVLGTERIGDVEVTSDWPLIIDGNPGYFERTFTVVNHAPETEHEVEIAIPGGSELRGGGSIRRRFTISPGATLTVSLLQPPMTMIWGSDASVTVDGEQRTLAGAGITHHGGYRGYVRSYGGGEGRAALASKEAGAIASSGRIVASRELAARTWLAYSGFQELVITAEELSRMSGPAEEALIGYVHTGGDLILLDADRLPSSWPAPHPTHVEGGPDARLGFGGIWLADAGSVATVASGAAKHRRSRTRSATRLAVDFHVMDDYGVPVLGLFILMIGYALVIGPVNVIALSRLKRLPLLLVTVPAISLATSAGIVAYGFLAEGITPLARTTGVTILDQRSLRASTIGEVGIYAPLVPSDGLRLPYDAEVTLAEEEHDWYGKRRSVDWSTCQNLSEGWISPRMEARFTWRSHEQRRERLEVRSAGGSLEVVNGLSVAVEELWIADAGGRIHAGGALAAGARALLLPTDLEAAAAPLWMAGALGRSWRGFADDVRSDPAAILSPGTYVAIVERNPFIEPGIEQVHYRRCSGVIYGVLSGSPGGAAAAPDPREETRDAR